MEIAELRAAVPQAFNQITAAYSEFDIPDELMYRYMIHLVSKNYSISPHEAAVCRELEFWEMIAFENLDEQKNKEYIRRLRNEQYTSK